MVLCLIRGFAESIAQQAQQFSETGELAGLFSEDVLHIQRIPTHYILIVVNLHISIVDWIFTLNTLNWNSISTQLSSPDQVQPHNAIEISIPQLLAQIALLPPPQTHARLGHRTLARNLQRITERPRQFTVVDESSHAIVQSGELFDGAAEL